MFLLVPGIYESEEDTTRRMKEDLLIRDNYAVVKNRIRAAESSEIDKIIAWVNDSPANFRKKEVDVLDEHNNVVGRIDLGIAEKFSFIYKNLPHPARRCLFCHLNNVLCSIRRQSNLG